jgi:hypothetical protein
MTAWLFGERELSWLERWQVGWTLWRDGISRWPWRVAQVKVKVRQ